MITSFQADIADDLGQSTFLPNEPGNRSIVVETRFHSGKNYVTEDIRYMRTRSSDRLPMALYNVETISLTFLVSKIGGLWKSISAFAIIALNMLLFEGFLTQ